MTLSTSNTNVFCQNGKQSKIFQELESNDFLKRKAAQNALTEYINNIDESERAKVIDELLGKIHDKNSSHRLKVGISSSIGQISTFYWKVKDQKMAENKLYELFKQTNEVALKKNLDSTLMKAEGLYWDAIHDYNEGRLNTGAVKISVAKFKRVFSEFPESTYASRAHYYLAKYYTRVYLKRKAKEMQADKNELIAKESNSTYQNYFNKLKEGKYKPIEEMDAHYYYGLNWVLLGKIDNAINELDEIRKSPIKDEYPIYVYEFYYSKGNGNVMNRYYPSDQLASYTIEYLQANPTYSDNYLNGFVDHLNKSKDKLSEE